MMLILLHWLVLAVLGFCALTLIGNLIVFRGLRPASPPAQPPLVSVLVPARNEARNIRDCVASLLAQDYPNWELLVIDDNSADETGKIVRELYRDHAGKQRLELIQGTSLPAG